MKSSSAPLRFLVGAVSACLVATVLPAQSSSSSASSNQTVSKPLTNKQIAKKQKELEKELQGPWKKWLNEDVCLHHHRR